jgi:copper chaperone CopZ
MAKKVELSKVDGKQNNVFHYAATARKDIIDVNIKKKSKISNSKILKNIKNIKRIIKKVDLSKVDVFHYAATAEKDTIDVNIKNIKDIKRGFYAVRYLMTKKVDLSKVDGKKNNVFHYAATAGKDIIDVNIKISKILKISKGECCLIFDD